MRNAVRVMSNEVCGGKKSGGFSIVEMIIYCAILMSFLYVLTSMFISILDVQLESEATSSVTQDSRFLLSRFIYDIERATAVVIPASLGEESSSLQLTIGGVPYTYAVVDSNLVLTNNVGANVLNGVGTRISNISFRRYGNVDGAPSVRISFTLTSTTRRSGGPEVRTFQTTVRMR